MMKVLVISHSSVVSSYRGKLNVLAGYSDMTVDLIVPPSWNEGGRRVNAGLSQDEVFTTHIVSAYRLNRIASYFYHPLKFHKAVMSIAPSLIYVEEEPWSVAAWQAVREGIKLNIPVVFFTWENISRTYKAISEKILAYVLAKSSGAVAGNNDAALLLKKREFNNPVAVLPQYGIDLNVFTEKKPSPLSKPLTIAYIGRLEHEKGVHILLDAMAKLPSVYALLIVGNGPAKEQLLAQAERLNILQRVQFVDAAPHHDVPSYLHRADVLVLPSVTTPSWKEQFGRVLVEAMACGIPVIGSTSGAIPEVIGDAGLVFEEGSSDDLAGKISALFSGNSLAEKFRALGLKRVRESYSDQAIGRQLQEFLKNITSTIRL